MSTKVDFHLSLSFLYVKIVLCVVSKGEPETKFNVFTAIKQYVACAYWSHCSIIIVFGVLCKNEINLHAF